MSARGRICSNRYYYYYYEQATDWLR